MWVKINFFSWLLLILSIIIGLHLNFEKRIIQALIWSRLFYWILIISQFILTIRLIIHHPILVIICDVSVFILIPLIEVNYRLKEQSKLKLNFILLLTIFLLFFIVLQSIILK